MELDKLFYGQATTIARLFCISPSTQKIQPDQEGSIFENCRELFYLSQIHGLDLLLFQLCQDLNMTDYLPSELLDTYFNKAETEVRLHQRRIEELEYLNSEFHCRGIPFLLLKEYAFDGTFGKAGSIKQNDFDILILPEYLQDATQLLEKMDYKRKPRPWDNEYRYNHTEKTTIDLQTSCSPHLGSWAEHLIETKTLFKRSVKLEINDFKIPVTGVTDNLIFLLQHTAMHHNFYPFSKIAACWNKLVLNFPTINAHDFNNYLSDYRLNKMAWFAVKTMESICGYDIEGMTINPYPPVWEQKLFFRIFPETDNYFTPSVSAKLDKRSRKGSNLFFYAKGLANRLNCLFNILVKQ